MSTIKANAIENVAGTTRVGVDQIGVGGFKNKLINGGFDIWQRGTSYTTSTTGYGQYGATDRWGAYYSGTTISKQTATINDTLKNVVRVATTGSELYIYQVIESGSALLANKTISYSYWARANKNTTISGTNIGRFCGQNVSSQSSRAIPDFSGHEVSTEWRKITNTVTLTDDSLGQSFDRHFAFFINIDTGVSSGDWIEISQVQLEEGSVATPFEQRPIATELALCQRYYWKGNVSGNGYEHRYALGGSALMASGVCSFPTTMRIAPTMAIVTQPTYINSSSQDTAIPNQHGFVTRVRVTSSGKYRAYNGIYSADAEL